MNNYLEDIFSQPEFLEKAVNAWSSAGLAPVRQMILEGKVDRVIVTGMGASYNAQYPAFLRLSQLPVPVNLVNAAELVHFLDGAIGQKTLLWAVSQSGRSAELVSLLDRIKTNRPAITIACSNDPTSPLATAGDLFIPINAGDESTVSTKTYTNTLALSLLVAEFLAGNDTRILQSKMLLAARKMQSYLSGWQALITEMDAKLGDYENLIVLGRGASLSAVWNGALINKEAAKVHMEGMHAADFRHGPIELIRPGLVAFTYAGGPKSEAMNIKLAADITKNGGRAILLGNTSDTKLPVIQLPEVDGQVLPLVEILPMQVLSVVLAARKGINAGQFLYSGKVTTIE